jgi:hypothetical protein
MKETLMNKTPTILDDPAREEAIIAALSRRRRADIEQVLELAARINELPGWNGHLRPRTPRR